MPQRPAHTDPAIIAAGMTLRMRGIEPTQANLYNALDSKGHPSRLWKVWSQHLAGANDNSPRLNEHPSEPMSPEMTETYRVHGIALANIRDCAAREAVEPLNRRIATLDEALDRAGKERDQLQKLVDVLYEEISDLREANEALHRSSSPLPSLILPTWPKSSKGAP